MRALDMRPDLEIAGADRRQVDMAALAGDRQPRAIGMDQRRRAEPRTRPDHHLRAIGDRPAIADRHQIVARERRQRQRQRLEVIKQDHLLDAEARDHALRFDHPMAIGQRHPVALDGPRQRQHGRMRRHVGRQHGGDRIVDGGEIGRQHGREADDPAGLVRDQREAGIGAANIADQRRERNESTERAGGGHGALGWLRSKERSEAGRRQEVCRKASGWAISNSAVARFSAIGMS